jgi:hypothetical protein
MCEMRAERGVPAAAVEAAEFADTTQQRQQ